MQASSTDLRWKLRMHVQCGLGLGGKGSFQLLMRAALASRAESPLLSTSSSSSCVEICSNNALRHKYPFSLSCQCFTPRDWPAERLVSSLLLFSPPPLSPARRENSSNLWRVCGFEENTESAFPAVLTLRQRLRILTGYLFQYFDWSPWCFSVSDWRTCQ